jgi:Fe-S-cluster-containing dehydrogenase component
MEKILIIDQEKCTGCRNCELVCSVKHTGASNPTRTRINVIKWENEGFYLPMVCQQCETPACLVVCPKEAISRDNKLGCVKVDYETCIGCRMCMNACPFGGMGFDYKEKKVIKCELCDGDPICVKFCHPEAIKFINISEVSLQKKRLKGTKLETLMSRLR